MRIIPVIVVSSSAGLAAASPYLAGGLSSNEQAPRVGFTVPTTVTVDVSGLQFNDELGAAINERIDAYLGPFFTIEGVAIDATLTTVGASWASDASFSFDNVFYYNPYFGFDGPVDDFRLTTDFIYLRDEGVPPYTPNFLSVNIELHDVFVDNPGTADAFFGDNSFLYITRVYPAPGTILPVAMLMLGAQRRRRE